MDNNETKKEIIDEIQQWLELWYYNDEIYTDKDVDDDMHGKNKSCLGVIPLNSYYLHGFIREHRFPIVRNNVKILTTLIGIPQAMTLNQPLSVKEATVHKRILINF